MLAPPLAGSSAGWARWRVEGCGGRAREAPVLSFPAGGGRPGVAPPGAPRPTTASAPRSPAPPPVAAAAARLCLGLARPAELHGPDASSSSLLRTPPRGARARLSAPAPGFPAHRAGARARSSSRLPPLFLALLCHWIASNRQSHSPDHAEPLPSHAGLGATRPPDLVPGLRLLAPGQRAFPSRAWSSPNLRAVRAAQGPHLSPRREASWPLTLCLGGRKGKFH